MLKGTEECVLKGRRDHELVVGRRSPGGGGVIQAQREGGGQSLHPDAFVSHVDQELRPGLEA